MAVFLFFLFATLSMFQSIDNTCGPPGSSIGADVYGHTSTAEEGQTVSYMCKNAFKQVYGSVRKCVRGKWTPRIPKCAIKQSTKLMFDNYKVNYFDLKESTGLNVNRSFEYFDYITLNSSRRFIFQIYYSPKSRLSYVELDLQILSDILPSNLKVSLLINDYRECIKSSESLSTVNSVIELKFICEAKSDVDYEIEGKDLPNSLRFSFDSQNRFFSRIIRISVFRFHQECGSPDIPLNARTIIDSGNVISIYTSKPERYKIPGGEFDTVRCLYEGNWNKEFEALYPIITCPYNDSLWNSVDYKNFSLEYFEYFNDTILAAVDSKIQFKCNDTSQFHYLYCQENGEWSGDFDGCDKNNGKIDNELSDETNFVVIMVTLLSTFVITITLTLIFGTIIVWRRNVLKKRQVKKFRAKYTKKSEIENYMHIVGEELSVTTGHYEAIDYDAIEHTQLPDINHYYMAILD